MKSNSTTVTLASVAGNIDQWHYGRVTETELMSILSEYSVHQEAEAYRDKMLKWGWLFFDSANGMYHLTDVGRQTSTIEITVPRLISKEARRHLVGMLAGFQEILTVGEVENDDS